MRSRRIRTRHGWRTSLRRGLPPATVLGRQYLKAVLWASIILSVAVLCDWLTPRTEEEMVEAVVWKIRSAYLERDLDTLRELVAPERREEATLSMSVRKNQEWWFSTDPDWDARMPCLLESAEIWEIEILRCRGVPLRADVRCRCSAEDCWCLWLLKQQDSWVLWEDWLERYEDQEWWARKDPWRPRLPERKVAAFLPKSAVDPRSVDLVVEIGPSGLDRSEFELLRKVVRRVSKRSVARHAAAVVDASPDAEWREIIEVSDALMCEEIFDIMYAAPEDRPYADTVKVNGTALADLEKEDGLPEPSGHPAIYRVIGVGQK